MPETSHILSAPAVEQTCRSPLPLSDVPAADILVATPAVVQPVSASLTPPTTVTSTDELPGDQRLRRAPRPRPGYAPDNVKTCTGCGRNARGNAGIIKCKFTTCSTEIEWVR